MNVKVLNISKHYNIGSTDIPAVDDISLDISDEEFVSLVGPTGSGKTTLLSIIGTLIHPDKGSIYYDNIKVSGMRNKAKINKIRRLRLAFAFQYPEMVPYLSVLENILMPYIFKGKVTREMEDEALGYISRLALKIKADMPVKSLSGGELKKVGLLRAIMYKPELLLADEPTGDLDPVSADEVMRIFEEINGRGVSIVMVSHDMEHAMKAKSVYRLEQGKIVKSLK